MRVMRRRRKSNRRRRRMRIREGGRVEWWLGKVRGLIRGLIPRGWRERRGAEGERGEKGRIRRRAGYERKRKIRRRKRRRRMRIRYLRRRQSKIGGRRRKGIRKKANSRWCYKTVDFANVHHRTVFA